MNNGPDGNNSANGDNGPKDYLELLRTSANDATDLVRKVYLTFLLVGVYLAILVGATTDEQLLRGTGAILPIIQLQLPIVGVYIVAPVGFLFLYLNLLIQLYLLSQKLHELEEYINKLPQDQQAKERKLIYSFPFNIMLVGKPEGLVRLLVAIMVKFSVIGFPIVLLLAFQLRFLPYHNQIITWIHRIVVIMCLILLWIMWPKIMTPTAKWLDWLKMTKERGILRFTSHALTITSGIVLSVMTFFICTTIFIVPGCWLESKSERLLKTGKLVQWIFNEQETVQHFFGRKQSLPLPRSWFPFHRNLDLREYTLVKEAPTSEVMAGYIQSGKGAVMAWKEHAKGLDLRDRDLRGASFNKSSLYKADLRGAKLQGANLYFAQLQGAILTSAKLQGANLSFANLQAANLSSANLQGANLSSANLQGANLWLSRLQAADLSSSSLHGADSKWNYGNEGFSIAPLVYFLKKGKTQFQGANLMFAKIGGADFTAADLDLSNLLYIDCKILGHDKWKAIREYVSSSVPKGMSQTQALKRLPDVMQEEDTKLPDATEVKDIMYDGAQNCSEWNVQTLSETMYVEKLVPLLVNLSCNDNYVVEGVLRNFLWRKKESVIASQLAKALIGSGCEAVQQLPKDELEELKKLAAMEPEEKKQ